MCDDDDDERVVVVVVFIICWCSKFAHRRATRKFVIPRWYTSGNSKASLPVSLGFEATNVDAGLLNQNEFYIE